MLTGLRNTMSKGLMRYVLVALMGLLVVSFAIWGIGDIFRGGTTTTLASVGRSTVSVQSFQNSYNREVQQLGRLLGRGVTPDQARAFGIEQRVLNQLVTEATLNERARQLGLGVEDQTLSRRVTAAPVFRGPDGRFDRNAFQELLRQNGFNETTFIAAERDLSLRQQIASATVDRMAPSATFLSALARHQNETRTARYVVIGARAVGDIPAPDEAALATYFESRKASFRAPEYRKLLTLTVSPQDQAPFVQPPEDRLEAEFNRLRGEAERREVLQIPFPTPEEAAAASGRMAGGLSFEDLARERNIAPADLTLGVLSRPQIADPAVRDAAFALAEGQVSAPVRGRFGTVILKAQNIAPFNPEATREEARRRLTVDLARVAVNDLHDRIERERNAGTPLAEIAVRVGLQPTEIDTVDAGGRDKDGVALDIPNQRELLEAAFRAEVGIDPEPIVIRQTGAYIWYEVAAVTPARERQLAEVRAEVEARWREEEAKTRIGALATDLSKAVAGGRSLDDVAREKGVEVRALAPINRSATPGDWGQAAVQTLFATPTGQAASAPASDGVDQIVFVVGEAATPEGRSIDQRTLDQARESIENDLLQQYVTRLQAEFGLTVNRALLRRATGGGDG